ncbi:hypothetical protein Tco_1403627 [Tanacetum coccineum]
MALNRSKSRYAIKECSTCGSWYTKKCCSIGNLKDQIIVPVSDSFQHCAVCGTPVDGPYCHGCTLIRTKFEKDLFAYCVDNGVFQKFQDTSESSNDNTNVVNAPREPSVVDQDTGVNISQDPPQIDHNCCYECGDSLNGIFCQKCICEFCGRGAHFGYNCPPKDPIISEPEKNLSYNQNSQSDCFSHDSQSLPQQYFCCENCGGSHETYQCQPMNQEYFYSQFLPVSNHFNHPKFFIRCLSDFLRSNKNIIIYGEAEVFEKKEKAYEDEKYAAACRYMLSVTCDDDDDDNWIYKLRLTSFSDNSITRGIESDRDSGEDTTSIDDLPLDDSMILSEYESFTFDDEPVMAEVNVISPDFDASRFNIVEGQSNSTISMMVRDLKRKTKAKTDQNRQATGKKDKRQEQDEEISQKSQPDQSNSVKDNNKGSQRSKMKSRGHN